MEKILKNIKKAIESGGGLEAHKDYLEALKLLRESDIEWALREVAWLKPKVLHEVKASGEYEYYNLYRDIMIFEAPYIFDSYLIAMEFDREPEKKFYMPRREVLKVVVDDLQDLADRKIKFLSVSLPPRTGKSTLGCLFMSWLMGKNPDKANVMSGHSDKLTSGFYQEVLSMITDEEYNWKEIFPECSVAGTSAKDESIDINTKKRFSTLTCRSVGGTLTGAVEVGNCLYCDDLIEDLEEALNPDRLQNKYDAYANQLKDRMKLNTIQLMIGTRWAVGDVQGRIQEQYYGDPEYRFRVIPALNSDGESNFNYPYALGFDKKYFEDMRESIDDATWSAKYMGVPYDREGVLIPKEELQYFNGELPGGEPDKIVAACDVAWGGGDYLSMPIAYVYGDDVYIKDVAFSNGKKDTTQPIVAAKIVSNKVQLAKFEANNGGEEYADSISNLLKAQKYVCSVTYRRTTTSDKSKKMRIVQYSPEIMKYYYVDDAHASTEYRQFMSQLCRYTISGKNKNDDAIDSMAQLVRALNGEYGKVTVFQRPF